MRSLKLVVNPQIQHKLLSNSNQRRSIYISLFEGIVTGLQSGYSPLTFIPASPVIIKTVSVHTRLQLTVRSCPMVRT